MENENLYVDAFAEFVASDDQSVSGFFGFREMENRDECRFSGYFRLIHCIAACSRPPTGKMAAGLDRRQLGLERLTRDIESRRSKGRIELNK